MSSESRAGGLDLDAITAQIDNSGATSEDEEIAALRYVARTLVAEVRALRTALRQVLDALDRAGDIDGIAMPEWIDGPDGDYPGGAVTRARAVLGAPERDL